MSMVVLHFFFCKTLTYLRNHKHEMEKLNKSDQLQNLFLNKDQKSIRKINKRAVYNMEEYTQYHNRFKYTFAHCLK